MLISLGTEHVFLQVMYLILYVKIHRMLISSKDIFLRLILYYSRRERGTRVHGCMNEDSNIFIVFMIIKGLLYLDVLKRINKTKNCLISTRILLRLCKKYVWHLCR